MVVKKVAKKIQHDNEAGSRRAIIEDLFYDFHKSRAQVYKMNFIRGIFFGLGTVVGATIIVAMVVWVLSFFTDLPGATGQFIQYIVDTVKHSQTK